jgi:hypothetical protein
MLCYILLLAVISSTEAAMKRDGGRKPSSSGRNRHEMKSFTGKDKETQKLLRLREPIRRFTQQVKALKANRTKRSKSLYGKDKETQKFQQANSTSLAQHSRTNVTDKHIKDRLSREPAGESRAGELAAENEVDVDVATLNQAGGHDTFGLVSVDSGDEYLDEAEISLPVPVSDGRESAWAQGGGGCHSMIAQQGFIRGFRFALDRLVHKILTGEPVMPSDVANFKSPIFHTTSSGGTWMWTAMLAFQETFNPSLGELYGMDGVGWLSDVVLPNVPRDLIGMAMSMSMSDPAVHQVVAAYNAESTIFQSQSGLFHPDFHDDEEQSSEFGAMMEDEGFWQAAGDPLASMGPIDRSEWLSNNWGAVTRVNAEMEAANRARVCGDGAACTDQDWNKWETAYPEFSVAPRVMLLSVLAEENPGMVNAVAVKEFLSMHDGEIPVIGGEDMLAEKAAIAEEHQADFVINAHGREFVGPTVKHAQNLEVMEMTFEMAESFVTMVLESTNVNEDPEVGLTLATNALALELEKFAEIMELEGLSDMGGHLEAQIKFLVNELTELVKILEMSEVYIPELMEAIQNIIELLDEDDEEEKFFCVSGSYGNGTYAAPADSDGDGEIDDDQCTRGFGCTPPCGECQTHDECGKEWYTASDSATSDSATLGSLLQNGDGPLIGGDFGGGGFTSVPRCVHPGAAMNTGCCPPNIQWGETQPWFNDGTDATSGPVGDDNYGQCPADDEYSSTPGPSSGFPVDFHLAPAGASECDFGTNVVNIDMCAMRVAQLKHSNGDCLETDFVDCVETLTWFSEANGGACDIDTPDSQTENSKIPTGCSAKIADDGRWHPTYKAGPADSSYDCNDDDNDCSCDSAYQLVCTGAGTEGTGGGGFIQVSSKEGSSGGASIQVQGNRTSVDAKHPTEKEEFDLDQRHAAVSDALIEAAKARRKVRREERKTNRTTGKNADCEVDFGSSIHAKCSKEGLLKLFGPCGVCVKPKYWIPPSTYSYKDLIWTYFFKENGLPWNATFKYMKHVSRWETWWLTKARVSLTGDFIQPVSSEGLSPPAIWSEENVVWANAGSSNIGPAMIYQPRFAKKNYPECKGLISFGQIQNLRNFIVKEQKTKKAYTKEAFRDPLFYNFQGEMKELWEELKYFFRESFPEQFYDLMANPGKFFDLPRALIQEREQGFSDVDGAIVDNQAILPLILQIEQSPVWLGAHGEMDIFPVVLMTGALGPAADFYQAVQYFTATIPFKFAPPTVGYMVFDIACPPHLGDEMVPNRNYAMHVPPDVYGPTDEPNCQTNAMEPIQPLDGCVNLWSKLAETGIFYVENVTILRNPNWNITGGWKFRAFSLTTQMPSYLSKVWLQLVDPQAAQADDPMMVSFPTFPSHSLMQVPIKYAYLLSNYLGHLSMVQQYCFKAVLDLNYSKFCTSNPDLCPCEEITYPLNVTVDFVFPIMV